MIDDSVALPRWLQLASELGGVIGRSTRPICFILGAGCSISSGAPTTATVEEAFRSATAARFVGVDFRKAIHTMPESEKQDVLRPLFADVSLGPGYLALAALGRHWKVLAVNLNWDKALANACRQIGVNHTSFDLNKSIDEWPSIDGPGVYDVHVHGIIGHECRYGHLETLSFTPDQERWLMQHGLANTTAILGVSLVDETDFSQLFMHRSRLVDPVRPPSSQWFFLRGADNATGLDRLRRINVQVQPFTYECAPDIDFDLVATVAADRALALARKYSSPIEGIKGWPDDNFPFSVATSDQ